MSESLRDRWIAALRSGEYKQITGVLRDYDGGYCCLGVACKLAGQEVFRANKLFGDSDEHCETLAHMNDKMGKTFAEIADYIEAHPEIDPKWPVGGAE